MGKLALGPPYIQALRSAQTSPSSSSSARDTLVLNIIDMLHTRPGR